MSAVWGRTAKKVLLKLFWMVAALLFSILSTMAFGHGVHVNGRLIDLTCGSMVLRAERYVVMHSQACLNDPQVRGGLAILTDNKSIVIRLTDEQEKTAMQWRKQLAFGEVYVSFDIDGKIIRNILPTK
jgi:hypothetical protein